MGELESILDRIGEETSGYLLGYYEKAITHLSPEPYSCRAWWGEHGPWFHGYGMTRLEAAQDCLQKILEFKPGARDDDIR